MAEMDAGTRVRHTRYGWVGTVVEGPRHALIADDPQRVEVRWDGIAGERPRVVNVERIERIEAVV